MIFLMFLNFTNTWLYIVISVKGREGVQGGGYISNSREYDD